MLEHVTAVRHVEHAILEGQLLAFPDPVVDLQAAGGRMPAGSLDQHRRGINANHVEPKARELLGKETTPATNVQGSHASSPAVVLVGQDLTEVGEAARGHAAVQDVERAALIDLIVDRHRDISANCLSLTRARVVFPGGCGPQRSLQL